MPSTRRPSSLATDFHILLVEDSRADVTIIERALADRQVFHRLTVLPDGRQALAYVDRLAAPDACPDDFPDLVLLDLNLPGIDGFEVLTRLKSDPALRPIPVVVLTTSRLEADVLKTYRFGANTYIQKPSEFPRYCDLVATIRSYWLDTAVRPRIVPHDATPGGG